MKNVIKFLPILFIGVLFTAAAPESTCPTPFNVTVVSKPSNSIYFDWNDVDGVEGYQVWYVRHSDGFASSIYSTTSSDFSFLALPAGGYDFHIVSDCGSGSKSADILIVDIITN